MELFDDDMREVLELVHDLNTWMEQQPYGTGYMGAGRMDMDRYLALRRQGMDVEDAVRTELIERRQQR